MKQLSQTIRIRRSPHTGVPIVEELNTVYGYYATIRFLNEAEYKKQMLLPTYDGPIHEAEKQHVPDV
jgi:hypothetical protein